MENKQKKSGWSYFIVLMLTVAFISANIYMDYKNKAYASEQFLKIEVKQGDTIWDLSNIYKGQHKLSTKEFIKQVEELNNMDADLIKGGQTIVLPVSKKGYKG